MDIFSNATLREAKHRFRSPRMITVHRIEVLYADGSVDYLDEYGHLSSRRDDALECTDVDEAAEYYALLCLKGLNASIETSQRVLN